MPFLPRESKLSVVQFPLKHVCPRRVLGAGAVTVESRLAVKSKVVALYRKRGIADA